MSSSSPLARFRPTPVVAIVLMTFTSFAASGCLSHRYEIPREELSRLVKLPPHARGQNVRVVQQVGQRRAEPVTMAPPIETSETSGAPDGMHSGPVMHHQVQIHGWFGGAGGSSPPTPRRTVAAPASGGYARPADGVSSGAGPTTATTRARGGGRVGGGSWGGGGKGDELAVVAVVIVALAAVFAVAAVGTEGMRYDGHVSVWPGQLVYLKGPAGGERAVPLGDLTEADVSLSGAATVMDDEGYGVTRLGRRPLDRKGLAFKLDVGTSDTRSPLHDVSGLASHLQLGWFPHQRLGLLASLTLTGGDAGADASVVRHAVGLELQAFPLSLGRIHFGAYGEAGLALAAGPALSGDGPTFGGGGLVELALTTRLALMFRAGWSRSFIEPGGQADALVFTGGVAIY